jgi:hypothetical protein
MYQINSENDKTTGGKSEFVCIRREKMELVLTKNGRIKSKEWNGKRYVCKYITAGYAKVKRSPEDTSVERILSKLDILCYLRHAVELESGFTLRSYFKLIENYPALQSLDYYFFGYVDEYKEAPKKNCVMEDISRIELSNVIDLSEDEGVSDVQAWINFSGRDKTDENQGWALDFSPLAEMLDIPIALSGCRVNDCTKQNLTTRKYKEYSFSFWEFLMGIIDEISFCGTSKDKKEMLEHLKKMVKDIEDGEAKLVPVFNDQEGE